LQASRRFAGGHAILLFLVSSLSVLSDKLVLVSFTVPAVLAALLVGPLSTASTMRRAYAITGVIVASVAAAQVMDQFLNRQPDIPINFMQAPETFWKFLLGLWTYVPQHSSAVLLCLVLPLVIFLGYPFFFGGNPPDVAGRGENSGLNCPLSTPGPTLSLATGFLWSHAALAMMAVVLATGLIAYSDYGSYRYLTPALSWPLVFTIAATCIAWSMRGIIFAAGAAATLVVGVALLRGGNFKPGTATWHSPLAECLKAQRDPLNLHAGLAEYWISRPVMVGSSWSLQVNQATEDGHVYIWGNDPYWYTKSFADPNKRPVYNFVIMENMEPKAIMARFGQPTHIHVCGDGELIWVYSDSRQMTDVFLSDFTHLH
jgi:hypothetical protein